MIEDTAQLGADVGSKFSLGSGRETVIVKEPTTETFTVTTEVQVVGTVGAALLTSGTKCINQYTHSYAA